MDTPRTLLEAVEYFSDLDRCTEYLVSRRWPNGVTCPTCGSTKVGYRAKRRVWECSTRHPRREFSVKVGTIFEDSPLPLSKWLPAVWMIAGAKNGISSHELARALGITQKSAWFMLHRIRLAMQNEDGGPMSGDVEADETFIGGAARFMHKHRRATKLKGRTGHFGKAAVFGLLERSKNGKPSRVRTRVLGNVKRNTLQTEIRKHVVTDGTTTLYTDALRSYEKTARKWTRPDREEPLINDYVHKVIDHAIAYADGNVHTNGMENFWSLLKRTIKGTYVSVEPFHLFRYLDEQAFRFNERDGSDWTRFESSIGGILGRRVTYRELTGERPTDSL
jgi:transposase-like protein